MFASHAHLLFLILALVATHAATLSAQSVKIDGSWSGEATAPAAPPFPVVAVFKTDGKALTGTISVDDSPPAPISEAALEGTEIFFVFSWFGGEVAAEGTVSSNEIKLKAPTEIGITFDIVLTRKK